MRRALVIIGLAIAALVPPAWALDLELPSNARKSVERNSVLDSYRAPRGPYEYGIGVPVFDIEGEVRRQAWRIASPGLTPLQVLIPLRGQVKAAGYRIMLDCDQVTCGGFDFRFDIEALPAPNMRVNIRAFRFLTAIQGPAEAPERVVTLLVSTTATAAYVQIVQAGQIDGAGSAVSTGGDMQVPLRSDATPPTPIIASGDDFDAQLLGAGHIVLGDLEFNTGSADLGEGPFDSLRRLSEFLKARPGLVVALVGHTDSVGSLDGNINLSKRRAASVRKRMVDAYGIKAARMQAEGMGYLSPVASNLDEQGRDANRRVEVVLLAEQ